MSRISRIKLLVQLSPVVTEYEQTQSTFQGMWTARETARRSCQTCQIMSQLGVVAFNRVGVGFTFRNFISTIVIPQAVISLKGITEILFGLGRTVNHLLNILLHSLPDHFAAQIAARLAVYDRNDVDPVFLLPIKVNSSSISAVLTSFGTGVSGRLAVLAFTHSETVRWWIPR